VAQTGFRCGITKRGGTEALARAKTAGYAFRERSSALSSIESANVAAMVERSPECYAAFSS